MAPSALSTAEKMFLFVNVGFAVFAGALLATSARLAWDPSTYAWFRFLCAAQYRASLAYTAAAGAWLLALVALAAAAAGARRRRTLRAYGAAVAALAASEVAYGAWMAASLAAWWRSSPRAALARQAMDALHDFKPALHAVERHKDLVRPVLEMIEEVEREAPNNVYVIVIFGGLALLLQVAALVLSWRLSRRPGGAERAPEKAPPGDESDDSAPPPRSPPAWRRTANLRMYTILDKIF